MILKSSRITIQPILDLDDSPVKKKRPSKFKSKSEISDESDAYTGSAMGGSDGDETDESARMDLGELRALAEQSDPHSGTPDKPRKRPSMKSPSEGGAGSSSASRYREGAPLSPIHNTHSYRGEDGISLCGLCGTKHGDGACYMTESSENLAEYRQMLILHAEDEPMEERVRVCQHSDNVEANLLLFFFKKKQAAIRVIDETLFKRGKLHLIDGQPLHLLTKTPPAPRPRPRPAQASSTSATQVASTSKHASNSTFPMDMASSLPKRAPSPSNEPSSKKKAIQGNAGCAVCGGPHHLVKDCPKVLQGPKRQVLSFRPCQAKKITDVNFRQCLKRNQKITGRPQALGYCHHFDQDFEKAEETGTGPECSKHSGCGHA